MSDKRRGLGVGMGESSTSAELSEWMKAEGLRSDENKGVYSVEVTDTDALIVTEFTFRTKPKVYTQRLFTPKIPFPADFVLDFPDDWDFHEDS